MVGLVGSRGAEHEVSLDALRDLNDSGEPTLVDFLSEKTNKSRSTIGRAIARQPAPDAIERLRVACGDDDDLLRRVVPYHALIRDDPWGEPVIVPAGSIVVTAGPERRGTGTYYTPRAITEEVVTHALEPLVYRGPADGKPRDEWVLRTPAELLELKICDFAMGSGAFLVQACRWLGERLVESWERAGADDALITPEGRAATGEASEMIVPAASEERRALARRLTADRCLYGVDVNPLAVEMAKLSMWLVTLAKGRPFSFLDHALKCGDSLLGIQDLDQLRHFHVDPDRGRELHATLFDPTTIIKPAIEEALHLRRELESFTVLDVRDAEAKRELYRASSQAVERLRLLGDLVIGIAISTAARGAAAFDESFATLGDRLSDLADAGEKVLGLVKDARDMLNHGKPADRPLRRTFHWPLEFPEVFSRRQAGFDAIIGNPPFRGGKRISGTLGVDYREHLVRSLASGTRGNADLVAYFFLRATQCIRVDGTMGLLATNTLAQGDTREVGLDRICASRSTIFRAWKSRPWPGDASVEIALVWLYRGQWRGDRWLDGVPVRGITSMLDPRGRVTGLPHRLLANDGRAFYGSLVNGSGFLLSNNEAQSIISRDARNRDVLLPYLMGEDLNVRPDHSPSRWVINFFDWPLDKAAQYPELLELLRGRAKPQRDLLPDAKRRERERWWLFERRAVDLYRAISGLDRVIALARTSSTVMPVLVPSRTVFGDAVVVFAYDSGAHLGLLSSAFHRWWAVTRTSTIQTGIRYTPTDCFQTFPLPAALGQDVDDLAVALDNHRRHLMLEREEGLTTTYNRVNDSKETSTDIVELRRLHVDLDIAIAAAYGWPNIAFDHGFYETPQGVRYTVGPIVRVELTDLLLELNHDRHRMETASGLPMIGEPDPIFHG
jgi:hypothetical protein